MSDLAAADIPEGYSPLFRTSPVLELIGPIYCRGSGAGLVLGMRVAEKHCNARGGLHGGILATLADVALGYAMATSTNPPRSLATSSLTVDFVGGATVGDWLETETDIQKLGGRFGFANCYIVVNGSRIARASGVFTVTSTKANG